MRVNNLKLIFPLLALLWIAGCQTTTKENRPQEGVMDTPKFHTLRAEDAIAKGDYNRANASYQKALDLNSTYSPALSGKAMVLSYIAKAPGSSNAQKVATLEKSNQLIEDALSNAKTDEEKGHAHNAAIQVYLNLKLPADEWHEKAEDHYEDAVELMPTAPGPHFYMARAESERFNFNKAATLYHKVLEINTKYKEEANAELAIVQKIQRAQPGSNFGKQVAFVQKLTRADVAGLFIAELRLDRLYNNKTKTFDTSFQTPTNQKGFEADRMAKAQEALDIGGHALEDTIREIIKLKVKGLEPDPSHKFYPNKEITRGEYALMIQDILVKVTGDPTIQTKYIGTDSSFPDVRSDVYYYNAARVMVERNLMQVTNKVTGEFAPLSHVMGADALLVLRDLKEALQAYTR